MSLPPEVPQPRDRPDAQPATEQQLREVEREMTGFERATLRWARVAVVMSGLAALFVCLQWWEMHQGGIDTHALAEAAGDAANAASDQTDAAQQFSDTAEDINSGISDAVSQLEAAANNTRTTIKNAEKSFQEEQRAWVGVLAIADIGGLTETDPWKVTAVFFNGGRTPARNVQISVLFVTSPIPISGPSKEQIAQLTFRPAQSIAPQGTYRAAIGSDFAADASTTKAQRSGLKTAVSQYELIKNKQLFLYYFGILKYDDSSGKHRETQYCIFLANPDTKQAAICDSFNDLN